jgi:hypothetical protein
MLLESILALLGRAEGWQVLYLQFIQNLVSAHLLQLLLLLVLEPLLRVFFC